MSNQRVREDMQKKKIKRKKRRGSLKKIRGWMDGVSEGSSRQSCQEDIEKLPIGKTCMRTPSPKIFFGIVARRDAVVFGVLHLGTQGKHVLKHL